ncbi:MAG: 6-bladed beta-propeller [Gemmatimonadetes bacterium]|nr:6-bladed beta-propeller [Gemmatimonadota bacterium]
MTGRPVLPTLAGVLVVGAIAGCEEGPDPANWPEQLAYGVRDSAGVTIVASASPATGSRLEWRVGPEPRVSVGAPTMDEDYQLYEVGDASRLADGRIVVANGGSNQVLVFDHAGNYLAAWAGQGEGPGEFRSLGLVESWTADSLIAADSEQGRVSIFDLEGNHGRTTTLMGEPGGVSRFISTNLREHRMTGLLPDGMILTRDPGAAFTEGFWRWDHAYGLANADGSPAVSLGEYPGPEVYSESVEVPEERMIYITPLRHPFGKTTFTAVWGDLVAFGRNETYEIRAFASDGSLARIVRREHVIGSPTEAQLDAAVRAYLADLSDEDRNRRLEVAANVPMVETFPAYSGLQVDALGHLWVREFRLPGDDSENPVWTVFDPEGRALGFVETPPGVTIYEIGADYILGKRTDELDIEYVEVWELIRQ